MAQVQSNACVVTIDTPTFPTWIPGEGQYGRIPMLDSIADYDPTAPGTNYYGASDNMGIVDTWTGAVFASGYSAFGGYVVHSGGDSDWNGNDVYVADLSTLRWARILGPTEYTNGFYPPYGGTGGYYTDMVALANNIWKEFPDGSWLARHSYAVQSWVPASWGVGAKGALLTHPQTALVTPHLIDLASPAYDRFSDEERLKSGSQPYWSACYDEGRNCVWLTPGVSSQVWYKLKPDRTIESRTGFNLNTVNQHAGYAPPPYDCFIETHVNCSLFAVKVNPDVNGNYIQPGLNGTKPTTMSVNGCQPQWDPDRNCFLLFEPQTELIFKIIPPSGSLTANPWTITSERLQQSAAYPPTPHTTASGGVQSKFRRIPAFPGCFIYWSGPELQIIRPTGA